VDSKDAALAESGDVIAGAGRLAGEIGAVANGVLGGRRSPDEVTVFKSLGVAVEDVASAELVWRRLGVAGG
jgi:ornithine cyclodeaminase/alanine dehydrogenase-like protein (mu-crystallin family)